MKSKTKVNSPIKLNDYKQQVADLYSDRSSNYDNGDWHLRIAQRIVDRAQLKSGQQILDLATGTGIVAIEAAQIVGTEEGRRSPSLYRLIFSCLSRRYEP